MKIQDYTKQMVDEKSFIDMAYTLLNDKGETMNLYDIIDEFRALGDYEYEEIENRVVQILHRFKHRWSFFKCWRKFMGIT